MKFPKELIDTNLIETIKVAGRGGKEKELGNCFRDGNGRTKNFMIMSILIINQNCVLKLRSKQTSNGLTWANTTN